MDHFNSVEFVRQGMDLNESAFFIYVYLRIVE